MAVAKILCARDLTDVRRLGKRQLSSASNPYAGGAGEGTESGAPRESAAGQESRRPRTGLSIIAGGGSKARLFRQSGLFHFLNRSFA